MTLDREGRITCLTAVAADLLGVGRETVRGGTIGDLLLDDGRLAEALEVVLASGGARELDDVTPRLRRGVGLRMVVRLAGIPGESGSILGVALALRAQRWRGEEIPSVHGIVGRAPATRRLVELVETLASSDATVLVTGESGTGKELVARGLHRAGPRAKAPFLAVNCATLTETLLESELFGHARGAFTGADRDKPGRLELCGDGTLLLDEVGCLPPNTQAKLLRVLEQREFHRLGGTRTLRLRARIVAATNADLAGLVRRGEFREDLYYRLRVVPLHVPPLRERRSDIRLLARHFAMELATAGPVAFDPAAERALEVHDWPGNVRELRNAIQYALATSGGHHVAPSDLPPEIRAAAATTGPAPDTPDDERGRIECALERARYNRTRAARALGMSRSTLWRRMRDLGIDG